ncbi:hypothetical protein HPB49_022111 [Dermacentor silvarum]|uniref:Uncharacterized protein n=1 Tax=Dermacentor silvarum TaxID=543639 RepID=A0ACB8D0E4_DERSI|nr:hypothetical protein HPB49_022111 [Dermacentor silvarum]
MAPPGKTGSRPRTATAIVAVTQVGYDPLSMMWTTVPSSDSRRELPQPFKSAALAAAVARREQANNAVTAACANAASPDAAADAEGRTCSPTLAPPAPRSAGPQHGRSGLCGNLNPYRSRKQQTSSLYSNPGRSYPSPPFSLRTGLVVRSPPTLERPRLGWSQLRCAPVRVPACGHSRLVTVRSSDTEATLRESLYWSEGEILQVRRLGTSNKVRLTFSGKLKPMYVSYDALLIPVQPYKKTVPACGRCGSVGHRPDSCPGPKPDLCGICGKAVPLTDGARAPHECTPMCCLCAGPHVTADRCCKERYRTPPPKSPTPPPEGQSGPKKRKRRRPRKPRKTGPRASPQRAQPPATNPTPPPHPDAGAIGPSLRGQTPDGPPTRKSTTRQVSPASPQPHPPSPEPKPTAQGDLSWATRVRQGPQVSGSGGAASPPPPSMIPHPKPPTPSTPTREQIAIRQLQAQVASLTQAVEALANRLPSANLTQSGQALEAMDSAPSEHKDTTALLAPIEARVSSLEAHVASIVTTIEDRLAAALQTVVDRIPGMIVAQLPKHAFSTSRPKLKRRSNSQVPRPSPHVAAVDRQSKVSIATSDVSTGSSSGAPMDLSALLEAAQISSSRDGGQRL